MTKRYDPQNDKHFYIIYAGVRDKDLQDLSIENSIAGRLRETSNFHLISQDPLILENRGIKLIGCPQ